MLRTGRGNAASPPPSRPGSCRDRGLAILVVSRDLAVLVYIWDRIGCDCVDVMHSGRLLEMTIAAALAEGRVTDSYWQQRPRTNQGVDACGGVIDVAA